MKEYDRNKVLEMMRVFYASPAVLSNGSEEIFKADIDNCINESPYLEGYVFEKAGQIIGYGMLAKSFSTEFGRPCVWIEDLYLEENYRGCGIGSLFFRLVEEKYPDSDMLFGVDRLSVEGDGSSPEYFYTTLGGSGTYPITIILNENGEIFTIRTTELNYNSLKFLINGAFASSKK